MHFYSFWVGLVEAAVGLLTVKAGEQLFSCHLLCVRSLLKCCRWVFFLKKLSGFKWFFFCGFPLGFIQDFIALALPMKGIALKQYWLCNRAISKITSSFTFFELTKLGLTVASYLTDMFWLWVWSWYFIKLLFNKF